MERNHASDWIDSDGLCDSAGNCVLDTDFSFALKQHNEEN